MEELKNDDVHLGIALRILYIFSKDHPENPYISQIEAKEVLFPTLREAKMELCMRTFENWFNNVDKNGDLKIDAQELAAHLKKLSFTETKSFNFKLKSTYEAFNKNHPSPVPIPLAIPPSSNPIPSIDNLPEPHDAVIFHAEKIYIAKKILGKSTLHVVYLYE